MAATISSRLKPQVLAALTLLPLLVCVQSLKAATPTPTYPCAYAQTVNISEGLRLKDGSYSYEGLLIPANMTALYTFQVVDGILSNAPPHMRGCVCRQRPCITFCCPPAKVFDELTQSCVSQASALSVQQQRPQHAHIEITAANGSVNIASIRDMFVMRYEIGCSRKYINEENEIFWKWDLFANGSLSSQGRIWDADQYCFTPLEHKKVWSLVPLTCERSARGFRLWIYVICIALAILIYAFILLTLVSIKAVRNGGYGESLIFYLASTIIGLSALLYLALRSRLDLSETACRNIGFIAYVFLMFSFFLLTIISWNFWYNFKSRRLSSWKRKLIYMLAFALAVALRFLLKFIQDSNVYQQLKPGIGDAFCWFDVRLWGILLYFYIPIVICLALSMTLFLKTYLAIWNLPEDVINIAGYDVKLIKAHFYAFFAYLLGAMCVWMRELIVYLIFRWRNRYFIIDFLTGVCLFGLALCGLIFLLYKNPLVRAWWHVNVTFYLPYRKEGRAENGVYLTQIYRTEQVRTDKLKEGYKDEIKDEDIALK
ncbi:PREDICTED: probable G-protein coupled receptor Mth-like 9 isoform X1 [Rhagoletis zephyria]|uniref:probable G-protein coupled receptor Mth-like 9 isoform X1 n=1 Tax=Rhagoletis zephyria TaxID=28612 RepID=UPI000811770A|nr:PREDICTED: probable G-protein coupled receptor Mth-like 9 isoform X1 [Rhagoletis zephyria]